MTATVKTLLRALHDVHHVIDLDGWSGTKDLSLYDQATQAGFEAILTNDAKQMQRRTEVEAIAKSGIHRVQYPHKHAGLTGVGLAIATVCAALPAVLQDLAGSGRQRLVTLRGIDPARNSRYVVCDPTVDPPKFWPWAPEPR